MARNRPTGGQSMNFGWLLGWVVDGDAMGAEVLDDLVPEEAVRAPTGESVGGDSSFTGVATDHLDVHPEELANHGGIHHGRVLAQRTRLVTHCGAKVAPRSGTETEQGRLDPTKRVVPGNGEDPDDEDKGCRDEQHVDENPSGPPP